MGRQVDRLASWPVDKGCKVGARLRRVRSQRDYWWAGQVIPILPRPFAHGRHAVAPLPLAGGCDVIASLPLPSIQL